jgi:hypothetical protein
LQELAQKLQTASQAGNQDAREWFLDLKSVALAIQAEQNQVANLLGALHNFAAAQANQIQQLPQSVPQSLPQSVPPSAPWGGQPAYPQQQPYPPQGYYPQQPGGMLGGLLNSGFGRAMVTGMGFGIGDDLINKIF